MRTLIGLAGIVVTVSACSSNSPNFSSDPNANADAGSTTVPTPTASNTTNYPIAVGATTGVTPGGQVGYSITALGPNSYRVVWTGDAAATGIAYHQFNGTLWATHITALVPGCAKSACPIEASTDTISAVSNDGTDDKVTWATDASIGFDGFDFTTDGGECFFDMIVDGARRPDLVYLPGGDGGPNVNPATIPFGVTSQ